jgi:hypothetical protein
MTLKWMDGVDHYGGDAAKAVQGAFLSIGTIAKAGDISGLTPRTGDWCIGVGGFSRVYGGDYRVAGFGHAVWCHDMQSDDAAFIAFQDADGETQVAVNRDSTGNLRIRSGNAESGTLLYTTASPVLTTGAWIHMEARIDCDVSSGAFEVRINGITVVNLTGINTRPHTGAGRVSKVAAAKYGAGHPGFAQDDLFAWVNEGISGETLNDFIGDKKVATLYPNAESSGNGFTINAAQVAHNNGASVSGNTGCTLGAPASLKKGDLWIAVLHSSDQNPHSLPDWNEIIQDNGGGTTSRLSVWWFRYEGTVPNMTATKASGLAMLGKVKAFRNVRQTGDPIDTVGILNAGSDASIEHLSITPSQSGCVILLIDGSHGGSGRTAPSGYTLAYEYADSFGGSNSGAIALAYQLNYATGATGDQTENLSGTADWTSVQIALAPATDMAGYQAINEASPDDDVTYLGAGTAPVQGDYGLDDLPSTAGTVSALQAVTRAEKTDAGPCNIQSGLVSGGSEVLGADTPITTAYAYYSDVFPINPATGAPFTPAEVNALYLRLKRTA